MSTGIELAREILRDIKKWGMLYDLRLTHDQFVGIILDYEANITIAEGKAKRASEDMRAEHNARVAELTGRIGGLQKTIGRLEAELAKHQPKPAVVPRKA